MKNFTKHEMEKQLEVMFKDRFKDLTPLQQAKAALKCIDKIVERVIEENLDCDGIRLTKTISFAIEHIPSKNFKHPHTGTVQKSAERMKLKLRPTAALKSALKTRLSKVKQPELNFPKNAASDLVSE